MELTRELLPPTDVQLSDAAFTRTQLEILSLVTHARDALTLSAIAQALQLTQGAVTQAVDGLVTHGMVERLRSPRDGRARILELTPEARQMVSGYESAIVGKVAPWFADLKDADLTVLARLLGEVRIDPR